MGQWTCPCVPNFFVKINLFGESNGEKGWKHLEPFTHYKINQTEQGMEVVLYLNENLTEFSNELGTVSSTEEVDLEKEAISFVQRVFPSLNLKKVYIVVGAVVVTTLGVDSLANNQASAAEFTEADSQTQAYRVVAGDTLFLIAQRNGTTVDAIKQANGLSSDMLSIGQTLRIPSGVASTVATTYKVVSGDTLYGIAQRSGTTVAAIKQANGLSSDALSIDQTLTIPGGVNVAPPSTSGTSTYRVVSGDTLYGIAQRSGTTVTVIKQANGLSSDALSIGQTLTIPGGGTVAPPSTSGTSTYQVVSGDTLYSIAQRNGTTVAAIKQANGLSSDMLSIGQTLRLSTGGASTQSPAQTESISSPSIQTEQRSDVNQEDLEWLAKMIFSEGRGESFAGQIAIGAVILNRVKSPLFPNNIKDVLFEKSYGYYQFTPAETGAIYSATPTAQNIEAARRALNGEDPTNGALFFYNPNKTSSTYLKSRAVSTVIGNHTFAY